MYELMLILKAYDEYVGKLNMALATVVYVEGSSYRRLGARMLVLEDGRWFGGVSGGCLEGDALIKAKKAILSKKPSLVTYDTRLEDNYQIGVGLGCNGMIKILFTPLIKGHNNPLSFLREAIIKRDFTQLYHIIGPAESQALGLVFNDSERTDNSFLGLTAFVQKKLSNKNKSYKSEVLQLDFEGVNYQVLSELIRPNLNVFIAGHHKDVVGLASLVKQLGWNAFVYGHKRKMPKEIFHLSDRVFEYNQLESTPIDDFTAIILMTHDLEIDIKIMSNLAFDQCKYVGIMGPKSRFHKLRDRVLEANDNKDLFLYDQIHAPIGLDIGGVFPEEIHLSILSEMVAVFSGRCGGFLKHREGPIN